MPIIRGDRFLLCSDGLVDEIPDEAIQTILLEHSDDPTAAAQALVDAANLSGGRDNITAIVIDVLEGDDPPDPTEEFDVIPVWDDDAPDITGETQIVADPLDDDPTMGNGEHTQPLVVPLDADTHPTEEQVAATAAAKAEPLPPPPPPRRKRSGRLGRLVLALGVAAVLVLAFAILAAWARSGYFVAFDEDGTVVIYQGRQEGVLWFEPTREAKSNLNRDELDDESITLVEQQLSFESQADAARFIAISLSVTTTTSTTTTTTSTTPPTTTVAAAPVAEVTTPPATPPVAGG
jgi:protein phosphatase